MKNLLIVSFVFLFFTFISASCSKSNDYSITDHTTDVVKNRRWTGYGYGYTKGDTIFHKVLTGEDSTVEWAKYFYYTTTDSTFSPVKINGFAISVLNHIVVYRSVNTTTGITLFDSTYANSAYSFLKYNSNTGATSFEFHQNTGHNPTTGIGYDFNQYLSGTAL